MKKIELLAPAGDLEKLKIAIRYGADAVFIGGPVFGLRARASNFTLEDIKEGVEFAHSYNKKVYVTMNIVPHNEDLETLEDYLRKLAEINVDAIIVSSLYIADVAKRVAPSVEIHLSTQMSAANTNIINFMHELGISRVVLAREVTLEELTTIRANTTCELEVFIHGGMCVSFSGRCMLSNYMTNRDANRGGCAHSCRWNYNLYQDNELLNDDGKYFNMASKDLNAIAIIPTLIDLGIESLKIEGRMKSIYYIATVVRAYRNLIDEYQATGKVDWEYYIEEIKKAESRQSSTGFLLGQVTTEQQLYNQRSENITKEFCGYVLDYDEQTNIATIEQRNYFEPGDELEFFGPQLKNIKFTISEIYDEKGEKLDAARHPQQILKIHVPFKLQMHDMVRRLTKN